MLRLCSKGLPFVNMPPERRADLLFRTGNPGNHLLLLTYFIVICNSLVELLQSISSDLSENI